MRKIKFNNTKIIQNLLKIFIKNYKIQNKLKKMSKFNSKKMKFLAYKTTMRIVNNKMMIMKI